MPIFYDNCFQAYVNVIFFPHFAFIFLFNGGNLYNLKKIIFSFVIENFPLSRTYVLSINFSLCFESSEPNTCVFSDVVLRNAVLPKKACDYAMEYENPGECIVVCIRVKNNFFVQDMWNWVYQYLNLFPWSKWRTQDWLCFLNKGTKAGKGNVCFIM